MGILLSKISEAGKSGESSVKSGESAPETSLPDSPDLTDDSPVDSAASDVHPDDSHVDSAASDDSHVASAASADSPGATGATGDPPGATGASGDDEYQHINDAHNAFKSAISHINSGGPLDKNVLDKHANTVINSVKTHLSKIDKNDPLHKHLTELHGAISNKEGLHDMFKSMAGHAKSSGLLDMAKLHPGFKMASTAANFVGNNPKLSSGMLNVGANLFSKFHPDEKVRNMASIVSTHHDQANAAMQFASAGLNGLNSKTTSATPTAAPTVDTTPAAAAAGGRKNRKNKTKNKKIKINTKKQKTKNKNKKQKQKQKQKTKNKNKKSKIKNQTK
jgi:hypothetical protein